MTATQTTGKPIRVTRGRLLLETQSGRAQLDGKALPVTAHWLYVYALLGVRKLEGQPAVTVEEINRLPTWTHVESKSLRTSAYRHADTMREAGLELLVSPEGERTKRFLLNPSLVRDVQFDLPLEQVQTWLGLQADVIQVASQDVRILTWVSSAEMAFEQGRYDDAETFIARVLKAGSTLEQKVLVLNLAAWIKSFRAPKDLAWDAIRDLHTLREAQPMPASLEASIWLQEGRFYTKHRDARAAKRVYTRASKLAGPDDDRIWGGIHFGLGYIAQWEGKLEESMRRYGLSLKHFSKARWAWGMQAQYNNLAAVCFLQHDRYERRDPKKAARWLKDAVRWLEETKAFVEQMDFGGAADLEVNLAYSYRILGDFKEARAMIDQGWRLAKAARCVMDQGMVCAERAELEETLGNRAKAIEDYVQGIAFLNEVNAEDWLKACQERLEELRGLRPLGKPLKLW